MSYAQHAQVMCWCTKDKTWVYAHIGPDKNRSIMSTRRKRSGNYAADCEAAKAALVLALRQIADAIISGVVQS